MRYLLIGAVTLIALAVAALVTAVAFGTSPPPPPIGTLGSADRTIGAWRSELPPVTRLQARDGTALAHRRYAGRPGGGLAVLVHGSSGSAIAMHGLATHLAARGATAVAVDMRGHGLSGPRGDIHHAGQLLEDLSDLAALLDDEFPDERRLLIGHSSGGGFGLRVAAGGLACAFDGYVALSPYLGFGAPTIRVGEGGTQSGGWARPFVPRIIGLAILRRLGINAFEHLPTVAFAVAPGLEQVLTTTYSFRLMLDFGPERDWEAALGRIKRPAAILVGAEDELFAADAFAPVLSRLNPAVTVGLLPGINHMGIVLEPQAQQAAGDLALRLLASASAPRCRQKP